MNDVVVLDGELSLEVQIDGEFGVFTRVGNEPNIEPLSIEENGVYTADIGVDGYNPVSVNVPEREVITESLSVAENGVYIPDTGIDGFNSVNVNVPAELPVINALTVNSNGVYSAPEGVDGYSPITVNVESEADTISGTFVLNANSTTITIPHDFGVIPTFALIYLLDEYTGGTAYHAVSASIISNVPTEASYSATSGMHQSLVEKANATTRVLFAITTDSATEQNVTFGSRNAATGWLAGRYHYVISK